MATLRAKILVSILVVALGVWGIQQSDWYHHRVIRRVQGSIVHLTDASGRGICTGFVIAPNRFLTAAHCAEGTVAADGQSATLVKSDEYYDLALFAVETKKPALTFRYWPVRIGQPITAIGYAWGTMLVFKHSEADLLDVSVKKSFAQCLLLDHEDTNGMSGGPVIDHDGHVVSIVSRGNGGFACGVPVLLMQAFLLGEG